MERPKWGSGKFHYIERDLLVIDGLPAWMIIELASMHQCIRIRLRVEAILDDLDGFI